MTFEHTYGMEWRLLISCSYLKSTGPNIPTGFQFQVNQSTKMVQWDSKKMGSRIFKLIFFFFSLIVVDVKLLALFPSSMSFWSLCLTESMKVIVILSYSWQAELSLEGKQTYD